MATEPSRTDVWFPVAPGGFTGPQEQGAERFERFSLVASGTLTLSRIGIRSLTADPANTSNAGHFASSDPTLNQIWDIGPRTLQLCEVPAASIPPTMTVSSLGAELTGAPLIPYQWGTGWHDYTQTMDVKILANEVGFAVRGVYIFTLGAANDRLSTPNQMQVVLHGFFSDPKAVLTLPLKKPLAAGVWHAIKIEALGNAIVLDVDGAEVARLPAPPMAQTPTTGSVGLADASGADALYRNIKVTSPSGAILYASPMTDPAVAGQFAAGTNPEPVILDGAKRDRMVWLGDLSQSAPVVYYTSGEAQYVKGSLQTLGDFRTPQGEIPSFADPRVPLSFGTSRSFPVGAGVYSLPYSIYFINLLHDYLLYTGDRAFVLAEMPAVAGELAYLARHTDSDGLLMTTADNGMDWALDRTVGKASEDSALYVLGLHNAAELMRMLGWHGSTALDAQADRTAGAINHEFYDAKTGVYDQAADHRGTFAQDANVMAVLARVAAGSKGFSVLRHADAALMTAHGPVAFSDGKDLSALISPFMSGYEVDAHFALGDAEGALKLIRSVWGGMIPGTPFYTGTTDEAVNVDGLGPQFGSRSLAHGWSAGATPALSEYVLGVRPLAAGFAQWIVQPQLGDLTWAKGVVPTPHGPIRTGWVRDGHALTLEIDVSFAQGEISLPAATLRAVKRNGQFFTVAHRTHGGRVDLTGLPPGRYSIKATLQ